MKTNIEVRFTDVDSQLHVNHTSIVEWIAHCRVQMLAPIETYGETKLEVGDLDHVLVHLAVNMCDPVTYPAEVVVTGSVIKVGRKSVSTRYLLHSEGRLISDAECINVVVYFGETRSVEIPDGLRELLVKL